MSDDHWLTSSAAAARLGVKPETLYAYVSRGMVRSERVPGTKYTRFLLADIERLAARRRSGGRAGGLEVIVETEITLLDPAGRFFYRGWNVADAVAAEVSFEEIASWIWTGDRFDWPFKAVPDVAAVADQLAATLPDVPAVDRIRAVVAAIRHCDPLRDDRRPSAVATTARSLIATLVESLPLMPSATEAPDDAPIARRLWPRLTAKRPTAARVRVLDAALVLLADHELATSTLAARVAASSWADPYLVIQAGLAALGGPLHGGASSGARRLIEEVENGTSPASAIGERLRERQRIAGFGHSIYVDSDPRAKVLLDLLERTDGLLHSVPGLIDTMRNRDLPFPNVDLALAAFAEQHDMVGDAPEIIFAVARIVGWLGHAAEEYQHRLRFRTRAVYIGAPPARSVEGGRL
jgi:citrate synthase